MGTKREEMKKQQKSIWYFTNSLGFNKNVDRTLRIYVCGYKFLFLFLKMKTEKKTVKRKCRGKLQFVCIHAFIVLSLN